MDQKLLCTFFEAFQLIISYNKFYTMLPLMLIILS